MSTDQHLDAVATFQVLAEGIMLSWLVVSSEVQNHWVGTFLVVLIQELVSMAHPGPPDLANCRMYTQCQRNSLKHVSFYCYRLGFCMLLADQWPSMEGAVHLVCVSGVTQVQGQVGDQSTAPALTDALLAWSGLVWLGGMAVSAVPGVVAIGVPVLLL